MEDSQREQVSRYILSYQPEIDQGTMATLSHCMHGPLTTEEVVDDGVGGTVGIHQPVGEGKAGIDSFPVAGLAEHPEHSNASEKKGEKYDRWAGGECPQNSSWKVQGSPVLTAVHLRHLV